MAALSTHLRSSNSNGGISRLALMQQKFQEKLMHEKESRLLEMAARHDAEREDIINRVTKSSSNSLSSSMSSLNSSGAGQGRVRRMFEERRNNSTSRGYHQSPKGYDKSFPLDPVKKDEGRPPRGGPRGQSVERISTKSDMGRSRSQGGFQRANRGDNRSKKPGKGPHGRGFPNHHKSASSLIEGNSMFNGTSRGPSPAPPSSTKSSPGPRIPVTPTRSSKISDKPAPPPKKSNFLSVDDNDGGRKSRSESRSRSGSRSPSPSPSPTPSAGKGFFARLGIGTSKGRSSNTGQSLSPRPPNKGKSPSPRPSKTGKSPSPRPPNTSNRLSPRPPNTSNSLSPRTPSRLPPKELILRNSLSTAASNRSGVATPRRAPNTPIPDGLKRCKICERNFAIDRIQKHEEICKKNKVKAKKRKIFDPVKMRTKGTEAEKFVARGDHLKETKKPKKKDWRKEHEDFIKTVRAAKGIQGYEAPPIDRSDYIECPHCGRKFNAAAADRHIPKCADITSNKNYRKSEQRAPVAPSRRRR